MIILATLAFLWLPACDVPTPPPTYTVTTTTHFLYPMPTNGYVPEHGHAEGKGMLFPPVVEIDN